MFFSDVFKWGKRLRVVNGELCPQQSPALFACNHLKLDDPFVCFASVFYATDGAISSRVLMRDDFFDEAPRLVRWLEIDKLAELAGAVLISRKRPNMRQLKGIVQLLVDGDSLMIFNGRTRSRSGMFFEYRDWIKEPASVSLFIRHARRRGARRDMPVVPMARTYNPVSERTAVVFGKPLTMPAWTGRHDERAFDLELAARMGDLVEINVPHIVSGLLYLRALHNLAEPPAVEQLDQTVANVLGQIKHRHIDPAACGPTRRDEVIRTLDFLENRGMLRVRNAKVIVDTNVVLCAPPLDKTYRRANPLKHIMNQVIHLRDLKAALERCALP